MAKFWLATFKFDPFTAPVSLAAQPLAVAGARAWAIEVIYEETLDEYAVLFSTVDDPVNPAKLTCRIGFANGAKSCSVWYDRGFPLVDASIHSTDDGGLLVSSPCYLTSPEMDYDTKVIAIPGAMLADGSGSRAASFAPTYEQSQQTPDSVFPATFIRRKTVTWSPSRTGVKALAATPLDFKVASTRCPDLAPFKPRVTIPSGIWAGDLYLPSLSPASLAGPVQRASRADTFGVPAFRFENVEMLGFRIDLAGRGSPRGDVNLDTLIERLNFHLKPPEDGTSPSIRSAASDFRYRPATRTVMLELLRYGKMKVQAPSPPVTLDDFQSQHELLVRILVGRVDDDTAQAHDPATFVPAIFVDNPWSKALGRAVLGFDKRMADFCVLDAKKMPQRLRPDGRLPRPDGQSVEGTAPEPLETIAQIHLATNTRKRPSGRVLLELDCPSEDEDAFGKIDLELALGASSLAPTRWGQTDFQEAEFRRSFARSAVTKTLKGFRLIQVSPIGEQELQKGWKAQTTWITGTFTFDDNMRFAKPTGIVKLTLHAEPAAPAAWKTLCKLLGIEEGQHDTISLPTGSWYRMRCSMDLTVDNGLD